MADTYKGFKSKEAYMEYTEVYGRVMSHWNVKTESSNIVTSFGDVHVINAGHHGGRPLVFFHAFGFSAAMWYGVANYLKDHYRLYFIDVLGEFNMSNTKDHLNEREDYIKWITEVLDALGIDQADMIGHSNGGWHVLNFALLKPERVNEILLLAPAAAIKRMNLSFYMRLGFTNLFPNRQNIVSSFCRWLTHERKPEQDDLFKLYYIGQTSVVWEYVMTPPKMFKNEELSKLSVPVTVAVGENEVIYKPEKLIKAAKEKFPQCSVNMISKAAHMIPVEAPEETANLIQSIFSHNDRKKSV
ncbi:alpha/beta fold hydrolase [Jeotgalibacillus aurantiacus]|uniref:alpha/beta fold hydrolase n=1 Tax=Jeotgalibacillus aurantiacus TaxID=2763266 RepID=UPI001D09B622|nr:alpha/beta hydrolase [Jeotgalibacillus aurantiacus]